MKHLFRNTLIAGVSLGALATVDAAHADPNAGIMNALNSRPELSQFLNALYATGVIHEMDRGNYTIFAPTNEAFLRLTQAEYPCLYSPQCRPDIAQIVRNHIVPGQVYVDNVTQMKGGVYAINHRFVPVAEPSQNSYIVDGQPVILQTQLLGGILYEINGVIANDRELASLRQLRYVPADVNRTTEHTVEKTYYAPSGRADGVSATTTVTRTTTYAPEYPPVQ